jgi:hypothetical protein
MSQIYIRACRWIISTGKSSSCHCGWIFVHTFIQGVPLANKRGISLIIPTPMKILQRNLNRSMFVVWETWRHHNVCWKWPPFASRQDWTRRTIFRKVLVFNTLSSRDYRYIFQLSCVNVHVTLTLKNNNRIVWAPSAKWQRDQQRGASGWKQAG